MEEKKTLVNFVFANINFVIIFRLEFYSEYQKKFRPFSQYDYIAGKFLAKDSRITPASSLSSGSWYGEVLELRKKAGEYKVSL